MIASGFPWLDFGAFLATLIPVVAAAAIAIIGAVRGSHAEISRQLQLPSNGTTLGAGIEAIGQKQDMAIGLAHPQLDSPSFVQLARELDPTNAPERRATDTPTPPKAM